jgi:hypothetical protein
VSKDRPVVISLALRSYPSWWRDRYGTDAASTTDDLLAEGRSPLALAGGCFLGALKERLRGPGGSSSPIDPGDRLTQSVIGTHGAWMLALPFSFLVEVMLVEQSGVSDVPRTLPVSGLEALSLVTDVLAVLVLGASVLATWRRARRTDRRTARLAALPLQAALFSPLALVVLVGLPLALDHWDWFAVANWHPRFLLGWHPPLPATFAVPGGTALEVPLLLLTWAVLIVGPLVAVWGFSSAARRLGLAPRSTAHQALLGSVAVVALAINWTSLLLWAVEYSNGIGVRFFGPSSYANPAHEPDVVFVLLALMLLPLFSGLRSCVRSWRAHVDLRRA